MDKSDLLYKEELERIPHCTPEEMEALFRKKDTAAEKRLVEGNLYRVVEAAQYFSGRRVHFMDLVQEGNIALMLLVRELDRYDGRTEMQMDEAIHEAMQSYAMAEEESLKAAEALSERLNILDEVCVQLADRFGREASAEEVAKVMEMDVEDVRYLMRIALNAIKKD